MKIRKNLVLILLFAGLGLFCLWLGSLVTPQQIQDAVSQCGSWAAAAYIGLFTLLPAFFFPVAVLALAGGLLFGLVWGSIYTFLGAILNCSVMFLLARYVGREKVERLIQSKLSPLWQSRLQSLNSSGGFILLIVLRLIPAIPYNLINYAFGLTSMSYRTYIIGSALGIIPGTLAFINIGDKALDVTSPDFWIAIGLLGGLLLITSILGKFAFPEDKKNGEKS
ncbi:MAG: TVP38/TMEM64 family protein [Ruminococcaceae bacterium]|nr:TVP38/TMEM64 family protein [Oscillospiraceae bacterium]